jgi:cysteine desulfurase
MKSWPKGRSGEVKNIYLDYNASTPIASEVIEAMKPFFNEHYGNPSTSHWAGAGAKDAVKKARRQVAELLGCSPSEVVFTSGGSESNNYALKGAFYANKEKGNHIITTNVEHPAILNPCRFLERIGAKVTYLDVDEYGGVKPQQIQEALTDDTILISVMHANNEVGTIQPLNEISKIAREAGVLFHTDASQSAGKIPTNVEELGVDLLTIAGHKLYAPKGVGALYIREGVEIEPLIHGAGHEFGRRAGTENVLFAVALGEACALAKSALGDQRILELRDYFWRELKNIFENKVILNGPIAERLPNTLNVCFAGVIGSELLEKMPHVAASTGSACHSGKVEVSPVLKGMGISEEVGKGAVRFSLGRYTTKEEIDEVLGELNRVLKKTAKH